MQKQFFITPDDRPQIATFFKNHNFVLIKNNVSEAIINTDVSLEEGRLFQLFFTKENFMDNIHFNKQNKKGTIILTLSEVTSWNLTLVIFILLAVMIYTVEDFTVLLLFMKITT